MEKRARGARGDNGFAFRRAARAAEPPSRRRWLRVAWGLAGALALVVGLIGVVVPLLPTTPFVLLAAFCFARSSERCERWMLEHARFGPILRECEGAILGRLSTAGRARLIELLQRLLTGFEDTRLPTSLRDRPGFLLARSHLRLRTEFERALEPIGIQARHFGALAICAHTPGSQQSLARELGVSGTIVVELVDALEQHGLAERRQNALDRRSYIIAPTRQGTAALERARGALAEIDDRIAGAVGGRNALDELGALLRRMLGVA